MFTDVYCEMFTSLKTDYKFRNSSRITGTYPGNLLRKMWIWVFWLLCYVTIFLWKRSCKAWLKITLPKTNRSKNSKATLKHSMNTDRKENVKFIVTNFKDRFASYITTTYLNMFSVGLPSVISNVFVADFEHVFVCWKRYSTKTIVVLILKYLAQQTNTY